MEDTDTSTAHYEAVSFCKEVVTKWLSVYSVNV